MRTTRRTFTRQIEITLTLDVSIDVELKIEDDTKDTPGSTEAEALSYEWRETDEQIKEMIRDELGAAVANIDTATFAEEDQQ